MERLERATFFNLLSGFKSPVLVGTCSGQGIHNLALFNSLVHIGANPPLLGFILRPTTVPRHTYQNIQETGGFTLNHVSETMYRQAHQTSAKYEEDASEFEQTGLEAVFSEGLNAPYVGESPLRLGLEFEEEHVIKANHTRLIVGRVKEIWMKESIQLSEGWFDPQTLDLVGVGGLENYYRLSRIDRLPYARP
jgi:flavin reductase (DIM6/NTAB) family NADH-FMN oxidoreductase RutF